MEVSKQINESGQEQFKLSSFATSGQAKGMTQPKVPTQNQASSQEKEMTQPKVAPQNQASGQTKGMMQNQLSKWPNKGNNST
ncbi:flagellar hook-length control protein FliK [Sesbania bispinosa]|nr:flagellar hook-length control protein FliK [Sesbania bispinosa]